MEVGEQTELSPRLSGQDPGFRISSDRPARRRRFPKAGLLCSWWSAKLGIPEAFELTMAGEVRPHRCVVVRKAPYKIRVRFQ